MIILKYETSFNPASHYKDPYDTLPETMIPSLFTINLNHPLR